MEERCASVGGREGRRPCAGACGRRHSSRHGHYQGVCARRVGGADRPSLLVGSGDFRSGRCHPRGRDSSEGIWNRDGVDWTPDYREYRSVSPVVGGMTKNPFNRPIGLPIWGPNNDKDPASILQGGDFEQFAKSWHTRKPVVKRLHCGIQIRTVAGSWKEILVAKPQYVPNAQFLRIPFRSELVYCAV